MTRKLIIHDGRAERELLLVGTVIVGRDPSCHINDLDPLLSRRHAEFVTTTEHVTLRDLGSRNGILVNGEKVHEQVLSGGDLVQLGHLQLRYVEDRAVPTADAASRAHAKTAPAMDAATMAAAPRAASAAELEDTKPHAPHAHAGHADADATRLPDRGDTDATVAPRSTDHDATAAPRVKTASPVAPPKTTAAADMDATFVPGSSGSSAGSRDLDATFAPGAVDLDATFAPGAAARIVAPPMEVKPQAAPQTRDLDAPFAAGGLDLDATFAPGAGPRSALASVDFDATFVPGMKPGQTPAATTTSDAPARIVAGPDMKVTAASAACRHIFAAAPASLLGRALGDVVAQSFHAIAAGNGSTPLTLVVERSPLDRTLTVTFTTGQHVETVS